MMNRNEEYTRLVQELETCPPALAQTLPRAKARLRRRRRALRPTFGLAGFAFCFVMLVNFCTPVAYACAQVPVLRELAAAVTFSPSLSRAVDNEYVQPIDLTQTANGITAQMAYLIVDQKQVNVFYRLEDSQGRGQLYEDPLVLSTDGGAPAPCSYGQFYRDEEEKLRCLTIDFIEEDVPSALRLVLSVYAEQAETQQAPEPISDALSEDGLWADVERDYLAEFTFDLTFDPAFTATGQVVPMNQTLLLDGQAITLRQVEIYPTHLRVDIEESPDNTAWLRNLDFTVCIDGDRLLEPIANGIVSTGSADTPSMTSYRTESPYFEGAESITLLISGADWLDKGHEKSLLDLRTGQIEFLPPGTSFLEARQSGDGWELHFLVENRAENHYHQVWRGDYYNPQGEYSTIRGISHSAYSLGNPDGSFAALEGFSENILYLESYPYDQVYLCPQYSDVWRAETPVSVDIPLKE